MEPLALTVTSLGVGAISEILLHNYLKKNESNHNSIAFAETLVSIGLSAMFIYFLANGTFNQAPEFQIILAGVIASNYLTNIAQNWETIRDSFVDN